MAVSFPAAAQDIVVTVLKPGAGFIAADRGAVVPLEIIVRTPLGPMNIKKARITANLGRVRKIRVKGPGRVGFMYRPPRNRPRVQEQFSVEIEDRQGQYHRLSSDGFDVPSARGPSTTLRVTPQTIDADRPEKIDIVASTLGETFGLDIATSGGAVTLAPTARRASGGFERVASVRPPANMPGDVPSYFLVLAASTNLNGFFASSSGISAQANVRIAAEIPPGNQLVVEGSENNPAPVTALADGLTTVYAVVRYGSALRVYSVKGRQRKEVSVPIDSGLVAAGLAMAIPGQNVADGGTGPSILVAIPPDQFGGEPFWPDIEVEGAKLIAMRDAGTRVKALNIRRPTSATKVIVTADGIPIGEIEFGAAHGTNLELNTAFPRAGERGAISAMVKDPQGNLTDRPVPLARLADGTPLPVEREDTGQYRVIVPSSTPGAPRKVLAVDVELEPPAVVAGDPPELVFESHQVELEGPPPAIKAKVKDTPKEEPKEDSKAPGVKVGLTAQANAGATFGADLAFGGAALTEIRLPVWDYRVGTRIGLEYFRTSGSGKLTFANGSELDTKTIVGALIIPVDVGVAVVSVDGFELLVRAGLGLRFESGVIDIGPERVGGRSRLSVGGRAAIEADIGIGDTGAFTISAGVAGLGTNASGLSSDNATLEGPLTNLRLVLGYRFWL